MTVEFKSFPATVKAVEDGDPNGSFEAVLSTKSVDRDGEAVLPGAFTPLPDEIPIYFEHDWRDGAMPVAKAKPFYDGDTLKANGSFAPTARAQELRQLVVGGFVKSMSVGFTNTKRQVIDGQKSVTAGELFESSFTGIPINAGAAIVGAKALKAGARNSATDSERLQEIHDLAVENGADCPMDSSKAIAKLPVALKSIVDSVEALQDRCRDALEDAYGDWNTCLRGVLPSGDLNGGGTLVFDWFSGEGDTYQQTYTDDGSVVTLTGDPTEVDIHEIIALDADADRETDTGPTTLLSLRTSEAPGKAPAPSAAADPAADQAEQERARIRALTATAVL